MKIVIIFLTVLIVISLSSCGNANGSVPSVNNSQMDSASPEHSPIACRVPEKFYSEEDFIKALKDGRVYSGYHPEEIKYYYHPRTLPEGAVFLYMQANYDYVMLFYTFDKTKPDDISKQIMYKTYRGYTTDDYVKSLIKSGELEYNLEGKTSDSRFFSFYSYDSAQTGYDSSNVEGKNKGQDLYAPPAWTVNFIQNGDCFEGNVPYCIDEKDITKYFEMEKVTIQ